MKTYAFNNDLQGQTIPLYCVHKWHVTFPSGCLIRPAVRRFCWKRLLCDVLNTFFCFTLTLVLAMLVALPSTPERSPLELPCCYFDLLKIFCSKSWRVIVSSLSSLSQCRQVSTYVFFSYLDIAFNAWLTYSFIS